LAVRHAFDWEKTCAGVLAKKAHASAGGALCKLRGDRRCADGRSRNRICAPADSHLFQVHRACSRVHFFFFARSGTRGTYPRCRRLNPSTSSQFPAKEHEIISPAHLIATASASAPGPAPGEVTPSAPPCFLLLLLLRVGRRWFRVPAGEVGVRNSD
jgi:hypothetical protein